MMIINVSFNGEYEKRITIKRGKAIIKVGETFKDNSLVPIEVYEYSIWVNGQDTGCTVIHDYKLGYTILCHKVFIELIRKGITQ